METTFSETELWKMSMQRFFPETPKRFWLSLQAAKQIRSKDSPMARPSAFLSSSRSVELCFLFLNNTSRMTLSHISLVRNDSAVLAGSSLFWPWFLGPTPKFV